MNFERDLYFIGMTYRGGEFEKGPQWIQPNIILIWNNPIK